MSIVESSAISVELRVPTSLLVIVDLHCVRVVRTFAAQGTGRARVVTGRGPGTRDPTGGHPGASGRAARERWAVIRHSGRVHMPPLVGASGWLNYEPLTAAELRGRVVLVNFWTWTCINWLRQEPYVRAWAGAYRDEGLVAIGVHTPEFSFEHDVEGVRRTTEEREIDYPVALDNDYKVWSAFANHYWPALYFVDADGVIRDQYFGEGRYERSERVIQRLLGVERELVTVEGTGVEAEADWDNLRTPETYLGYAGGEPSASPDRLSLNQWALAGDWTVGPENVEVVEPGGSISFRFHARDAHLVLSPGAQAYAFTFG